MRKNVAVNETRCARKQHRTLSSMNACSTKKMRIECDENRTGKNAWLRKEAGGSVVTLVHDEHFTARVSGVFRCWLSGGRIHAKLIQIDFVFFVGHWINAWSRVIGCVRIVRNFKETERKNEMWLVESIATAASLHCVLSYDVCE